jgi:hypothetical protein
MQRAAGVRFLVCSAAFGLLSSVSPGQQMGDHMGGPRQMHPPDKIELAGEVVVVRMGSFGNRPLVDVLLDGKGPFPFILDTGASSSVISAPFAEAQKIPVIAVAKVQSPGSSTPIDGKLLRIEKVEMGGLTITGLSAVSMDLSRVFHGTNDPVGVLSAGLFPGYLVTFDYPGKRIVLRAGELPAANGADVFEFKAGRPLPALTAWVAGVSIELDLDTGSGAGLTIPAEYAARVPLSGELVPAKPDRRVDRALTAKEGRLKGTVKIGRFAFENPTIRFVEDIPQGLVGFEILRRFAVTFDSKNHRLRLAEPG